METNESLKTPGAKNGAKKTAVITGASGNMGQAMVTRFLAGGYTVIGSVLPNDPVVIDIDHPNFEKQSVDVSNEAEAAAFVTSVISKFETIDVAILTVGGFAMGTIGSTSTDEIHQQYKLNFETAYNVARPAFTHMLAKKAGRIFLIGARPGLSPAAGKGMVAYSLAKSLIFHLAEMMNEEAKGTNVVTCVVVPSTIDTPQNRSSMPKSDFTAWVKPEAIADAVAFYCSEDASVLREPVLKVYNNA